MVRLSADPSFAVAGANTVEGERLRRSLAAREIPGERVSLFGAARGEVVLSEYRGEARLVQEADPEEIARHAVVFLCERDEATLRALEAPGCEALVLDLLGSGSGRRLVHAQLRPPSPGERGRFFTVPHGLAAVLAELLAPLARRVGVREAVAVVLRPAADFGRAGLEELREQAVRLLRFEPFPTDVFGRQLAFNLIPESILPTADAALEQRVRSEVAELLGWRTPRLAVRLLTAPVFHGHGISLRFVPERRATVEEVAGSWVGLRALSSPGSAGPATPLDSREIRHTSVSEVADDGLGGFWIWAVASEAGAAAAEQALEVALGLLELEGKRMP